MARRDGRSGRTWLDRPVPALLGEGVVLLAVGGALLAWTWRTWPDVLVDFGRELYVPWQLATGRHLYRDVPYQWGPLSPYVNALLFRTFGVGLMTLAVANVLLIGVATGALVHLLSRVADRLAATVAGIVFLALFAFAQLVGTGNYNFVTPYAHPVTHGFVLALAGIACLGAYLRSSRRRWLAGAGLALGGVFLAKTEVFAAAAAALGGGLLLAWWVERWPARRALGHLGAFAAAAVAPVLAALLLLIAVMPAATAVRGLLGTWLAYLDVEAALRVPLYQSGAGAGDSLGSVARMLWASAAIALVLGPSFILARFVRHRRHRTPAAVLAFALTAAGLAGLWRTLPWFELARPLPLFVLASGAVSLWAAGRARATGARAEAAVLRCALHLFGLVLLGKMFLNARLYHYGFVLAVPATLLAVVALLDWIPRQVERWGGAAVVARAGALAVVGAAVAFHLGVTGRHVASKTFTVGTGRDAILTDGLRGPVIAGVLAQLAARDVASRRLAVLPEGVMVNYLLRRPTSVPLFALLAPWGEAGVLAAFRAEPPDLIVLVHRDTAEYGFRFFGRDYGRGVFAWMAGHYRVVAVLGDPPFQDRTRFGAAVLERAPPPN